MKTFMFDSDVPKRLHESVIEYYEQYWNKERNYYGIVNSITRVARDLNQDDQQKLEEFAGDIIEKVKV